MTMDDLVYVQVASTDLSLYDKFNAAYRGAGIYWGSVATSWRPFRNPGDCGAPLIHPALFITMSALSLCEVRSRHCSTNTISAMVFGLAVRLRAPGYLIPRFIQLILRIVQESDGGHLG